MRPYRVAGKLRTIGVSNVKRIKNISFRTCTNVSIIAIFKIQFSTDVPPKTLHVAWLKADTARDPVHPNAVRVVHDHDQGLRLQASLE